MNVGWYVRSERQAAVGPMTAELVVEGIRAGRVPATALVCPVGSGRWSAMIEFPLFADAVREIAPPPPAAPGAAFGAAPHCADDGEQEEVSIAVPLVRPSAAQAARSAAHRSAPPPCDGAMLEEETPLNLVTRAPARAPARDRAHQDGTGHDDELIAELFDAMHELHFFPDALDAGDFCLRTCLEKLSCEAGIVHVYQSEHRAFVVTNARGATASHLLLRRTPETDPALAAVMRQRRPIVIEAPAEDVVGRAEFERCAARDGMRRVMLAPVMPVGRFLGAIELFNTLHGRPFTSSAANALGYIAQHFADFIATHGVVTAQDRIRGRSDRPGASRNSRSSLARA